MEVLIVRTPGMLRPEAVGQSDLLRAWTFVILMAMAMAMVLVLAVVFPRVGMLWLLILFLSLLIVDSVAAFWNDPTVKKARKSAKKQAEKTRKRLLPIPPAERAPRCGETGIDMHVKQKRQTYFYPRFAQQLEKPLVTPPPIHSRPTSGSHHHRVGHRRDRRRRFVDRVADIARLRSVHPRLLLSGRGGVTPPAQGNWKVASSTPVLDAKGVQARTFSGWMVPQEVLEEGDTTCVGYFDGQKRLTIAKQKAGGAWSSVTLDKTLNHDSHARIALALDTNGNLRVKTHTDSSDDKLEYWVTTAGDDLSTLKAGTMVPWWTTTVDGVTYPMEDLANRYGEFYKGADGQLFFRGRVGSAGGAYTIASNTTRRRGRGSSRIPRRDSTASPSSSTDGLKSSRR
ncbi:BNR-4 repeat-containing protein [Leifsonia sp. McL0607]|uniref:BNR-4 repeat-containing protein n=1 Tax=Leifsonia sp. McL0607 TaxID=3415672 RepID=UPI003CF9AF52